MPPWITAAVAAAGLLYAGREWLRGRRTGIPALALFCALLVFMVLYSAAGFSSPWVQAAVLGALAVSYAGMRRGHS